jgi:secreted PhoX family phosphatase
MNHEATTDENRSLLPARRRRHHDLPRPASEVDKELMIHGVSVVEVASTATAPGPRPANSAFNRRITTRPTVEISGPARGSAAGHPIQPAGTTHPRHAEQLRHRQDALGHAADG